MCQYQQLLIVSSKLSVVQMAVITTGTVLGPRAFVIKDGLVPTVRSFIAKVSTTVLEWDIVSDQTCVSACKVFW